MRINKPLWHEGLILTQQHFQQQEQWNDFALRQFANAALTQPHRNRRRHARHILQRNARQRRIDDVLDIVRRADLAQPWNALDQIKRRHRCIDRQIPVR
jgi:hypothetical protein